MSQEFTVSTSKLKQFRELIHSNYQNAVSNHQNSISNHQNAISTATSNYRNAIRSLQQMTGSDALMINEEDEKFLETNILAQMTTDEVHSLQSHLNDTRLIRDKLNWSHISSALMHELDDKISFGVMRVVNKLNISKIVLSEAMKKKLTKRMSKEEINYIAQLMDRAIQSTNNDTRAPYAITAATTVPYVPHEQDLNDPNLLIDIFNVYRIYKFSTFHFQSYEKQQFIKAIQSNKFIKENKDQIAKIFDEKYENNTCAPFTLYPSWLIVDDQFIICNYFFCASYIVNKLRANTMQNHYKLCICVIPNKVVSIYDDNIVFPFSIASDVSAFLMQNGFDTFSRTAIKESDAKDPQRLLQIIDHYVNCPGTEYLLQDVLLIIDRRKQKNVLYVLNASANDRKLVKLKQNHLLGMEFDILALDQGSTVVQCYLTKGIGEKTRFYPEYLTFLVCRLFKRDELSDLEYVRRVHASQYRHGFGTDLKDSNFDRYHKLILNSLHISVNYNRDYVASELKDDDDANIITFKSNADSKWAEQCNALAIKQASECPYIEFIVAALRTFSDFDHDKIKHSQIAKFDELALALALDHLVSVHSFCSDAEQRAAIKTFVQEQTEPCEHGEKCVILQQFSRRSREIQRHNDNNGNKREMAARGQMQLDNNDIKMNMIMDSLSTLHCYLEHHVFSLYREGVGAANNNKFGTIVQHADADNKDEHDQSAKLDSIAAINFGVSIHEWLDYDERPKYKSFRDEIINGSTSTIDEGLYNVYKSDCLVLVVVYQNKFGLLELMCIKLYTDTSDLCKAFRMAFWKSKNAKNKKMKKEFYWWALTLSKTMLYHSKPLGKHTAKSCRPKTLYHGLSDVFTIDDSCPFYNGPISTTSDVLVAHRFSGGVGLRWNILSSYSNPFKYVYGVDVHRISCFREENEVLLCNSHLPISSTMNYSAQDDDNMKIDLFLKQIHVYKRQEINASIFYNQIGFKYQKSWIESIKTHPLLYKPLLSNKNEMVIHRLRTAFNIKALDAPYTLLSTKFEQNEAFRRFGAAFQLNIAGKNVDYFKDSQYKLIFEDKQSKVIRYDESFQLDAKATVFVSNEEVFESKAEFELQQLVVSSSSEDNKTAAAFLYFDEDKQQITFKEDAISSTQKDILESLLNAKYQIQYCNLRNASGTQYGQEYKCAAFDTFACPVEVPVDVCDLYQINLMVAPLIAKTAQKNVQGKWFKYESILDDKGLFYGLATDFGETKKYSNPAEQRKVKIVSSEAMANQTSCLVDRKSIKFVIKGDGKKNPPFFYVNLGEYGLKPTRYTLRNSDKASGYLTNWCLLASTDGVEWVSLREHTNDAKLKQEGPFEAAVWDMNGGDRDGYFSYFKVLMTATNHAGDWQFGCCGFELYGHLLINAFDYVYDPMAFLKAYVPNKFRMNNPLHIDYPLNVSKFDFSAPSSGAIEIHSSSAIIIQEDGSINADDCGAPHASCKYESDFDTNGVFYAIGSQFGSQKYENPVVAGLVDVSGAMDKFSSVLVGRENKQAYTQGKFFAVDLIEYRVRPAAYTLKSSEWANAGLQDWDFEGSHDGKEWVCLKKHKSDDSQKASYASKTWTLDDVKQFYRFFRIMMTGEALCKKWVVCASGMELYGDLDESTCFRGTRGGRIVLISDSSITNYGNITANGTNETCFGSIDIKCKTFKNFGRIECKKSGTITIDCESFDNQSSIEPKPILPPAKDQ
eukprot:378191_1